MSSQYTPLSAGQQLSDAPTQQVNEALSSFSESDKKPTMIKDSLPALHYKSEDGNLKNIGLPKPAIGYTEPPSYLVKLQPLPGQSAQPYQPTDAAARLFQAVQAAKHRCRLRVKK